MTFDTPLTAGVLIRRYKRFLCDVKLDDGTVVTAHCPNSGRMTGCSDPGWDVRLSYHDAPTRKHAHTLELVHNGTCWIGVNTHRTNAVAAEAVEAGVIPGLDGFDEVRREVRLGANSRVDILGVRGQRPCYIEVKSVTMVADDGVYRFPDAPTARGRKHLQELTAAVADGARAVMLYVLQRSDGRGFGPADDIDPEYGRLLRTATAAGVEVLACAAEVSPAGITLTARQEPLVGESLSR